MKNPTNRAADKPRCGLCGKTTKLMRTECCGQWICDDEDKYVLFSYARNSCVRNHRRMTLCGFHHAEKHAGRWQDCEHCRKSFPAEMYVWYGTNEYNFEQLPNPPAFEPTHCDGCGAVIKLSEGGYIIGPKGRFCDRCSPISLSHPAAPKRLPRGARGGADERALLGLGMRTSPTTGEQRKAERRQ